MTDAFDPRIIRVTIDADGQTKTFEDLAITATGTKYMSPLMNECEVKIFNMVKSTRDFLLTETSPFKIPVRPRRMTLDVGRRSYGTFRLFDGYVIAGSPTQPPDIGITLRSLTGSLFLTSVISTDQPEVSRLADISQSVANSIGATLDFQATDRNVGNYSFTGGALKQIEKLQETGTVDAFLDNETLIVKDKGKPIRGGVRVIDASSGMVGIPEVTEQGIRVKVMLDNSLRVGQSVQISSDMNPAANGEFVVYKLNFDIATRDTPFYYIAECTRFLI